MIAWHDEVQTQGIRDFPDLRICPSSIGKNGMYMESARILVKFSLFRFYGNPRMLPE